MHNNITINQVIRESISLALVQLMQQKPFDQISVIEIVQAAGVSRSSFYRNFNDKTQVLRSYVHNLYQQSFSSMDLTPPSLAATDMRAFLLPRFRFIRRHGELFTALSQSGLLYTVFEQMDPDMLLQLCGSDAHASPYHMAMSAGACVGVIRQWIAREFRESPEDLAELFVRHP